MAPQHLSPYRPLLKILEPFNLRPPSWDFHWPIGWVRDTCVLRGNYFIENLKDLRLSGNLEVA
jgi:hypothetical protein